MKLDSNGAETEMQRKCQDIKAHIQEHIPLESTEHDKELQIDGETSKANRRSGSFISSLVELPGASPLSNPIHSVQDDLDKNEAGVILNKNKHYCCVAWFRHAERQEAWFLLIRVMIYHMLTGLHYGSFGLFYVEYSEYFRETKAAIGWIISIQTAVSSIIGKNQELFS